jgi:hypothetical protein
MEIEMTVSRKEDDVVENTEDNVQGDSNDNDESHERSGEDNSDRDDRSNNSTQSKLSKRNQSMRKEFIFAMRAIFTGKRLFVVLSLSSGFFSGSVRGFLHQFSHSQH